MINSYWNYGSPKDKGDYIVLIPVIPSDYWGGGNVRYTIDMCYFDGQLFHGKERTFEISSYRCFWQPAPVISENLGSDIRRRFNELASLDRGFRRADDGMLAAEGERVI